MFYICLTLSGGFIKKIMELSLNNLVGTALTLNYTSSNSVSLFYFRFDSPKASTLKKPTSAQGVGFCFSTNPVPAIANH